MKLTLFLLIITLFVSCDDDKPKKYWINSIHKGIVMEIYEYQSKPLFTIVTLDSGIVHRDTIQQWMYRLINDGDTIINK